MRKRILIIEDEPGVAENISYALETEGMEPAWCGTGREGLEKLEAGGVDLVILDVGLPDADGFEVCREIRRTSGVPVIFLTARKDEIDRVVGLELGADDYVVKPFSPRELTARVKAVLRRAGNGEAADKATAVGLPFDVDEKRLAITYYGKRLELSRYEYRILRTLIRRPGWVYSRDMLMEIAWEEPGSSMDRTVDAHIKNLRAKLHAVKPEVEAIKTHRGTGYSLRERW
ncbi:MAG: two-component system response regulator CreB [Planctomycetes bacterium]|nr:two-component system response regulator CreB [Planctomycetota bacterium]